MEKRSASSNTSRELIQQSRSSRSIRIRRTCGLPSTRSSKSAASTSSYSCSKVWLGCWRRCMSTRQARTRTITWWTSRRSWDIRRKKMMRLPIIARTINASWRVARKGLINSSSTASAGLTSFAALKSLRCRCEISSTKSSRKMPSYATWRQVKAR